MEDITPLIPKGRKTIDGYGDGGFTISSERKEGALLLFPEHVEGWDVRDFSEISASSLAPMIEKHNGLLLIGCGKKQQFLSPELERELKQHGLTVETMDTGAACRTYNILLTEGRDVAAALIAV